MKTLMVRQPRRHGRLAVFVTGTSPSTSFTTHRVCCCCARTSPRARVWNIEILLAHAGGGIP
jgi:hypothetical protein